MLHTLFIENFVLIDRLEVDFHPRMTVFTGETGAGKSIIIGALSLALGQRADSQSIGPFGEQTEIIAEFNIEHNQAARRWLQDQDLADGDVLIIRRTINQQGRSKQWVNGRPTPSGLVKELSQHLVQIHGQHDQIKLLNSHNQRQILDQSGDHALLLKQVQEAVKQIQHIEQEMAQLTAAGSLSAEQLQLLQYQYDELEQLALSEGEYEAQHQALTTAAHAQDLQQVMDASIHTLSQAEQSVSAQLGQVLQRLQHAKGQDFSAIGQMLDEALINVQEAEQQLLVQLEQIDNDPAHLQDIEQRLEQITHIARKQGVMPELLHDHHQTLGQTLQQHHDLAHNQDQLQQQLEQALTDYRQMALKLSTQRTHAGQQLSQQITAMVHDLGLPEARFSVAVEHRPDEPAKTHGNDHIEFMIAANKGQKAQPLSKTASGGELSRISLAIEVSTQQQNQYQVFVFDEVDTGIGGATAEKVGQIMQQLSQHNQVFAVTHLPQVAGCAHDHLLVSKSSHGQHTTSAVAHLDQPQRIEELARMSGGQKITEATLAQAKEFLQTGS
ncbi:DNA repair protein RecN [Marinicella meishanensis]|uniref:DNA repair protein RecN n=1 Tax=Marinicella meishanensis TaxID=2873263 RepID=UPI001CBA9D2F|nr:DNA repair protein RecN [Marinicella sp. NBU2979]